MQGQEGPVTRVLRDGVFVVTVESPPVNALSHAVREGLLAAVEAAAGDAAVEAVVISATGRTFMAGADITEFKLPPRAPLLPDLINVIEATTKPVVAALFGSVLGGGLEVALGCHGRVALAGTRLGLPEVTLGLLPGAGGTQRLPRLIGVAAALDMIVGGAPVSAASALELGLVDQVVDADVEAAAIALARVLAASGVPPRRVSALPIDRSGVPESLFEDRRRSLGRHPSGPVAPLNCIAAVEAAMTMPFEAGQRRERELFGECAASPYAKALQYAFFAERAAAQVPGVDRGTPTRPIESVGVIGAGTMGAGIAVVFAGAGLEVTLVDADDAALGRGRAHVATVYDGLVKRGRLTAAEASARQDRITPTLDFGALATCDLVIEAVFESMAVKTDVFRRLDRVAKPGAILATNTSTLDVNAIAAVTDRPADVLGLHFFSPANVMTLLEVVRARETATEVMATAMALAKRIGKVAVQSGVCYGFIGNRMLHAYQFEANHLLLEGALPHEIDGAMQRWGMAMGPFATSDLAGVDVGFRIREERGLPSERRQVYAVPDALFAMGRYGQKTGAGFYRYDAGGRVPQPDPAVMALVEAESARLGFRRRAIGEYEIRDRLLLQLANEGARLLDEGIALRASDVDVVWLKGYGFPAWRGGPMWSAEAEGLRAVVRRMCAFEADHGARWTPSPLLVRLAEQDKSFRDA